MFKALFLLIINISFTAQSAVQPVLPELANKFHNVRDFTVFKNEAYISVQNTLGNVSVIVRLKKSEKGEWTDDKIVSFSGQYHDMEPFLSADGYTLYFVSNRPTDENDASKDFDIWKVERKTHDSPWSAAINMGAVINTDKNEFYPSVANNGNLYFTANYDDSKGKDDIYVSEYKQGKYQKPHSLSTAINSSGDEYNAYIAPNEMYLIFGAYKRKDSLGSGDLYRSIRDKDGTWSQATNLGKKINSPYMDYCPFIDVKNNRLYFTSKRVKKQQQQYQSIDDMLKDFNGYDNGMSRIYKSSI